MPTDKIADAISVPPENLAPVKPKEPPNADKSIETEASREKSAMVQDDETAKEGLKKLVAKRTAADIIDRARERADDMRERREEAIAEQEAEEAEQEEQEAEEAEAEAEEELSEEAAAKRKTEQLLSEARAHERRMLNQPED